MNSESDVPPLGPAVAQLAARTFGGTAAVHAYYDATETNKVSILTCSDAPSPGWTTYSTVTLHATPNLLDDTDLRVELAGVARTADEAFGNVLASAAFCVVTEGWLAAPGVVFPGLVREYVPTTTTPHLMWTEPQPWPALVTAVIDGLGELHWLLGVPISEPERALLESEGYDALDHRLGSAGAEYFDLWRPSVIPLPPNDAADSAPSTRNGQAHD